MFPSFKIGKLAFSFDFCTAEGTFERKKKFKKPPISPLFLKVLLLAHSYVNDIGNRDWTGNCLEKKRKKIKKGKRSKKRKSEWKKERHIPILTTLCQRLSSVYLCGNPDVITSIIRAEGSITFFLNNNTSEN